MRTSFASRSKPSDNGASAPGNPSAHPAACEDVGVEDRRDGQTYCDWCYRPLTSRSIEGSERLGLNAQYSWACESCLAGMAYRLPPDGWTGTIDQWP